MCICTSSYRPYYPRDSQLAQRLQVNQTMGKQVLRLFRGCRRRRAARLDYLRHQDALSKGRILRMKQSRRSRVQLRLENSSVAPLLFAAWGYAWTATRPNALNCDGASEQWRSRKRLRPQRAGIPCQSRMPHRQSLLERSSLPACQRSFRCRKACQ